MIEISKVEACQCIDENDFSVMEDEVYLCFNSDQRKGRKQIERFFILNEETIMLEIYWDDECVHTVTFANRSELTEHVKARLKESLKERSNKHGTLHS